MNGSEIKKLVDDAIDAVKHLDEPLRSIAFREVLQRLLAGQLVTSAGLGEIPAGETPTTAEGHETIPQVTATGLVDALMQLLGSPWGREPRTLREIEEALRINAIHYPTASIAARLAELTKRGRLRRMKKGGVLAYVVSGR